MYCAPYSVGVCCPRNSRGVEYLLVGMVNTPIKIMDTQVFRLTVCLLYLYYKTCLKCPGMSIFQWFELEGFHCNCVVYYLHCLSTEHRDKLHGTVSTFQQVDEKIKGKIFI